MNKLISIIAFAVAFLFAACSDEIQVNPGATSSVPDGTPIEISSAIDLPEMNFGNPSRVLQENIESTYLINTLKVHLFVFDKSGAMRQFIEPNDIIIDTEKTTATTAYFKVKNIYASSEPRTLHFVIVPDITDLRTIKGGEYIDMMANETVVMPALQIGDKDNQIDAYWGRIEVDKIDPDNPTVQLKAVRNFAKVIVSTDINPNDEAAGNFKITAYAIVNKPSRSLIAPYITQNYLFAEFYDPDGTGMKTYEQVKEQGFNGINPSDANNNLFCTTADDVRKELDKSRGLITINNSISYPANLGNSAYYIYEHQQSGLGEASSSAEVSYIIIEAQRNGKTYYYKIDNGYEDKGKFYYYDVIRNFQYTININAVTGDGAATIEEAMLGAAVNNLTASVVTRDLFSIGYKNDKIEVSNTRAFITRPNATHTFRFHYTIDGDVIDPENFIIYDLVNEEDNTKYENMTGVTTTQSKGLPNLKSANTNNPVIQSASVIQMEDGWYELTFTTGALPESSAERYEQTLKVLYQGGSYLARTFTIMLRQPWEYKVDNTEINVGAATQSDVQINFTLPEGLSKTQFPIVVTFESDKQNIYAVPGEDLTVSFVKSQFDGATTDNVISYERRIEYEEYVANRSFKVKFRTNTTSVADYDYNTLSIDKNGHNDTDGRIPNNKTRNFCIRMGDRNPDGMKYFKPHYINYTRDRFIVTEFVNVSGPTNNISGQQNSNFSISFTLADENMEEADFPIVVTFESDKQNISSTALTSVTGKSQFAGASTTADVTIFQKNITWADYVNSKTFTVSFTTTTTSNTDSNKDTESIDDANIAGRNKNNGKGAFCIRLGDSKNQFTPKYINITRNRNRN